MNEKHCDHCNEIFEPRTASNRFCCAWCKEEFWKSERRQAMADRRQQRAEQDEHHAHE